MDVSHIGIDASVGDVFPPDRLREELGAVEPTVEVVDGDSLTSCDAVVTLAHREAFLDLAWIHSIQSGVDRFPFDALEAAGVALTNSAGIHGPAVGETVAGYMTAFARRLHAYRDAQRRGEWADPDWDAPFTLAGETLCVVGLGTLGRAIAERATGMGMRVVGVRRTPDPVEAVAAVHPPAELRDAIADARFVALALPLTGETRNAIGADELAAMRRDAYLLNVARGGVVEEAALVDALCGDDIAGAALDVFEAEPLPEDSPLWGMDEVIVTPHAAALQEGYYRDVADIVRENLRRIDAGEALHNRVV